MIDTDTAPEAERPPTSPTERFRRARTLHGALGLTLVGVLVPGFPQAWTRRKLGYVAMLLSLAAWAAAAYFVAADPDPSRLLDLAFDPTQLRVLAVVVPTALVLWAVLLATGYLAVRPSGLRLVKSLTGFTCVVLVGALVAAPVLTSARYALVQADLVSTVFEHNEVATTPQHVTVKDPWGGQRTVSVLLLGGDYGPGRTGVRTDTVVLLRADTVTGKVVMFSLPRNMMNAQFPQNSPLHKLYPDGFRSPTGTDDPGNWMLNAIYGQLPALHPGVLGASANEGADAIKQAVAGSLGIPVDYYALINLDGFKEIVNALGGVTVNINEPVAIQGDTSAGIPPDGYLEPGPNQHLNGYEALWFARGRYGSDDYHRMIRQRCLIGDLIDEVNPVKLLSRYQALAKAGKQILQTDIPAKLLPVFAGLAWKSKSAEVKSVAFVSSPDFYSGDPDYDWLRAKVQAAINPPVHTPSPLPSTSPSPNPSPSEGSGDGSAVNVQDSCAYTGPPASP